MNNNLSNSSTNTCDECGSDYFTYTSQLSDLCPECSHVLYGYKKCDHKFQNGRCNVCFWNGNTSAYINQIIFKRLNKSERILTVIDFLQNKYSSTNIVITDYWEADKEAIGLTDKTRQYLAYISTITGKDNNYFLALENSTLDDKTPYLSAGEFDNINITELEGLLKQHLRLGN